MQGGGGRLSHGYMLYPPRAAAGAAPAGAAPAGATVFGHGGLGGSVALADTAAGVAVAVTLNRLAWDTDATTGRIIRAVYAGLGLPVPAAYDGLGPAEASPAAAVPAIAAAASN